MAIKFLLGLSGPSLAANLEAEERARLAREERKSQRQRDAEFLARGCSYCGRREVVIESETVNMPLCRNHWELYQKITSQRGSTRQRDMDRFWCKCNGVEYMDPGR